MGTNCEICSTKCYGREGYDGSCCTLEDRDWIIGPHTDTEDFINRLSNKFGRKIEYKDVFIDYEEGKELFPDKNTWQDQLTYPALRVDLNNPRRPCIFYNTTIKACSIYDIRPRICQTYHCWYLVKDKLISSDV